MVDPATGKFHWSRPCARVLALVVLAIYLPALLAGVWIGARSFKGTDAEKFRKYVLGILAFLAVVILVKALAQLT